MAGGRAAMEAEGLGRGRGVATLELGEKVMAATRKGRAGRFGGRKAGQTMGMAGGRLWDMAAMELGEGVATVELG